MADAQRSGGASNTPRAGGNSPGAKAPGVSASTPSVKPVAARPAVAKPAGGDDALLSNLIDSATAKLGPSCEQCQSPMERGAILCARCGFNRNLGRAIKTRVMKAEKDKTPRASRGLGISLDVNPWVVFLGFTLVFVGLYLFAREEPVMVGVLYGAAALTFSIGYIYAIYGAFRDGDGTWGLIGIISFFFGFGTILMLYYVYVNSERAMSKIMMTSGFLGVVMSALAMFTLVDTGKLDNDANVIDPSAMTAPASRKGS